MSEEDQKRALEILAELRSILGFGIRLTKVQKDTMLTIDDGRIPFVEKVIEYGKQEAKIVPPFIDLGEYAMDLALFKSLSGIAREVASLNEIIIDTRMVAGSDAFLSARQIYNAAKGAAKAGVPGTQSMVDELGKLFENQGKRKKKEEGK